MRVKGETTNTVAIVFSEAQHRDEAHLRDLLIILLSRLEIAGISAYVSTLGSQPEEHILDLANRGCEGFILIGSHPQSITFERIFSECGAQYVGFNSDLRRNVLSDTPGGIAGLLKHFVSQGRPNFRLVYHLDQERFAPNSRLAGLRQAFPRRDAAELKREHARQYSFNTRDAYVRVQEGYRIASDILEREPQIEALCFPLEHLALGAARLCLEHGLQIGRDILLAGYNHSDAARCAPVPISTAGLNLNAVAEALIQGLARPKAFTLTVPSTLDLR